MTKTLKDILALQPKVNDYSSKKLEGVKSSSVNDLSTGTDPGVDYDPKDEGERQFIKKHKVEKHEDRVGNKDDVYNGKTKYALKNSENTRTGRDEKESKKVYEQIEEKVKRALGSRYISEVTEE